MSNKSLFHIIQQFLWDWDWDLRYMLKFPDSNFTECSSCLSSIYIPCPSCTYIYVCLGSDESKFTKCSSCLSIKYIYMYVEDPMNFIESKFTKCSSCSSISSSPCQHGRLRLPFVSIFRAFSSLWKSETFNGTVTWSKGS